VADRDRVPGRGQAAPAHRVDEVPAIFAALPHGDPRLRLLVELAAELRAGQAVRARGSDLHLGETGGFGLGRFVVHGPRRKHGEIVDLHPELRALVDEVLSAGSFAEAELRSAEERSRDYYLSRRAAQARHGTSGTRYEAAAVLHVDHSMFVAVERIAGVEHQQGRSFYGLREAGETDLAPSSRRTRGS
jgi:hypothetical protein